MNGRSPEKRLDHCDFSSVSALPFEDPNASYEIGMLKQSVVKWYFTSYSVAT
jgi:hypothetical protein